MAPPRPGTPRLAEEDFAQIQRIDYKRPFEECLMLAESSMDFAMGQA